MPTTINTPIYYIYMYMYMYICIYISINIGIGERGVIVMARYYLSQRVLLMCAHVRCRQHAALSLSACFLSLSGCFLSLSLDACSLGHCMLALCDTACSAAFLCVRAGRNKYACKVCHTHTEAQRSSASVFHDSFRRYA
jgi:hypothetical protein